MTTKIDCHTHIVTKEIRDEYFKRTQGFALVMGFLDKFTKNGLVDDSLNTVTDDDRLFLCPCVDIRKEIPPQLAEIEKILEKAKVVGIKIYLTYQKGRADDEKLLPVYEFCSKHNLSVTYHNGLCSLVLESDNDLEGSNAIYVKNMAEKFPDVNFIVAHMDDPRYDECINVIHKMDNMFTDFSGAYEPGTKEDDNMEWAIETFAHAINQYLDTYKQILYGTDFCPPINLSAIEEYEYTIKKIFPPDVYEDIYFNNALRAFPKLKEYIQKGC